MSDTAPTTPRQRTGAGNPWAIHRLFTRDGGYVVSARIPNYRPPAEIIAWGERVFILNEHGVYKEGIIATPAEEKSDPDNEWVV